MMTPLLPTIAHSLGTSVTAMGLAMMLYMLPYGLCQFFYGPLGDRLGAIRVVRGAAIGFAVGTLLTGQAHHIVVLDAARFVTGVFAAAVVPLTFAYIGATVPYAERHGTLGRFAAVTSLAQSLSAAIGGTVAHFVSWRFLYVGVGCLSLVPAALLFRTERSPRIPGRRRRRAPLRPRSPPARGAHPLRDRRLRGTVPVGRLHVPRRDRGGAVRAQRARGGPAARLLRGRDARRRSGAGANPDPSARTLPGCARRWAEGRRLSPDERHRVPCCSRPRS